MKNYRLLEIHFNNIHSLLPIYEWQYKNLKELTRCNIKMIFHTSDKDSIKLYGYDETEKWSQNHFRNLDYIFQLINQMPMSRYDKIQTNSDIIYEMCGLPSNNELTNHCFHDETHLTCCMLGGEARRYADTSGNPIGKTSEKAFQKYYGFYPSYSTLTPWCTCIGSEVCSYYTRQFKDGTHIKFIDDNGRISLSSDERVSKKFSHSTPGIP
jgi:hypothetical protein